MDNATLQPLTPNTVAAGTPAPGFAARISGLPMASRIALAGGVLALLGLLVMSVFWSTGNNYKVLFANLSDKDGGAIIAQLTQMNVAYKFTEGGSAILVPADKVHDVRLKLAQSGLPKGSTVGFELMDNARFGTTQFQERLNFQRGLEGELVRSITALSAVEAARVHLALPNQNGFFRDQQKPSASVLLTLYPGRTLDRAQLAGIVHLVSASVAELNPKAVSVLDQSGTLLAGPADGMAGAAGGVNGLDAQQLQYVNQIESVYTKRILDILEPVVGRDNLRAQVSAEVDFSQTESTSEEFKPNQGDQPAAVRSAQSTEQSNAGAAMPTGVPGAQSNQPPTPATAPINGGAQPMQTSSGGVGSNGTSRREAVTNYEVDKTVRVIRAASGQVKRLSAAVVVNSRSVTDKKGNVQVVALTAEEIDKLTALVRETVGFSKDRGDSVKVINAPFKVEKPVEDNAPMWKQPEMQDMVRTLAFPLGLALLMLIIVFGAIRPALKAARPPEPVHWVDAVVDDAQELPALQDSTPAAAQAAAGHLNALPAPEDEAHKRLDQARKMAKDNPAAVANIVRGWVSGAAV
jgi:flagellar M-ring protein FliF